MYPWEATKQVDTINAMAERAMIEVNRHNYITRIRVFLCYTEVNMKMCHADGVLHYDVSFGTGGNTVLYVKSDLDEKEFRHIISHNYNQVALTYL